MGVSSVKIPEEGGVYLPKGENERHGEAKRTGSKQAASTAEAAWEMKLYHDLRNLKGGSVRKSFDLRRRTQNGPKQPRPNVSEKT